VIGLDGLIFGGDAISVVVRDICRRQCWGAIGGSITLSSFSLSISLFVCLTRKWFKVKIEM